VEVSWQKQMEKPASPKAVQSIPLINAFETSRTRLISVVKSIERASG